MNSHQGFQTAALAVLCIIGVVLTTQLSSITSQYTDAKAAQEAAIEKATALKAKGEARITLGDSALGIEYLNSALSLNPSDEALRARLADLQAETILARPSVLTANNALTFHALFQQVIDTNGSDVSTSTRIAFGKVLAYRGLLAEAKAILDEIIKTDPESGNALLFRGDIYLQEKNWTEALSLFERAAKFSGDNPLVHFGRGVSLMELKKYKEAEEPLMTAAKKLNAAEPWLKLARVHALQKNWKDAELSFARAEVLKPNSAKLDPLYATALAERKKKDEAIKVAAVRARLTGDPYSYVQMGNWYLDLKAYENALPIFGQLRKLDENESDFVCKLGFIHEELKKPKEAVQLYEQCRDKAKDVAERKTVLNFANQRLAALAKATSVNSSTKAQ